MLIQHGGAIPMAVYFTSALFRSTSEGPALVFTPKASPVIAADGTFQQLAATDQVFTS